MNSSLGQKQVVLGEEYDDALRQQLLDVLKEFGAKTTDHSHVVGGSQELQSLKVVIDGKTIVVESETYIGMRISGDAELVDEVAARIRKDSGG